MKQYCRYCTWLCIGNGIWCNQRSKELSESYTKHQNKCTDYDNCNIDVYTGIERKIRVSKTVEENCKGQLSIFDK